MKLKRLVLVLAILFAIVGFAKAKSPTPINPQTASVYPMVELEEPTNILPKNKKQDMESTCNDSSLYNMGSLNLSFQLSIPPDSTDFSVVLYYIKNLMPIVKSNDSKKCDLIEIL